MYKTDIISRKSWSVDHENEVNVSSDNAKTDLVTKTWHKFNIVSTPSKWGQVQVNMPGWHTYIQNVHPSWSIYGPKIQPQHVNKRNVLDTVIFVHVCVEHNNMLEIIICWTHCILAFVLHVARCRSNRNEKQKQGILQGI